MLNYIGLAAAASFMGFFPMFEIYLAVPASVGLGLDVVSSVFWSWLGNFIVIPLVAYSFVWLTKFNKINKFFIKIANSKASQKLNTGGFLLIVIAAPLLGSWTVGVAGKMIGMETKRLFLASAIGIGIYGTIIGIFTQIGFKVLS